MANFYAQYPVVGGSGAPTNNPTFTGQVTIGTGSVSSPALQIETASEMGLYKVANGVMGFTSAGSKGMQLAGNYLGLSVPTLYLNVDSTAAVDTAIVNNVNSGTLIVAADSSGDTTHGGYMKAGGRSSSFGEQVQLGAGGGVGVTVGATQSVSAGKGVVATNATDGFLYIPNCAGTPTGTPTTVTGFVPLVYDTSANKFWIYNGSWRGIVLV